MISFNSIILAAGKDDESFSLESNTPKIWIDVGGRSLIKMAISVYASNLQTVIAVSKNFVDNKKLIEINNKIKIYKLDEETGGALATASLIASSLDPNKPIIITAVDSLISKKKFDSFVEAMFNSNVESGLVVFKSQKPNLSFVRTNLSNEIIEVAEKRIIGNLATAGIYYFRNPDIFLACAKWAFLNNVSKNGIFYIAPSLNYLITTDLKSKLFEIEEVDYYRFSTFGETEISKERLRKNEIL